MITRQPYIRPIPPATPFLEAEKIRDQNDEEIARYIAQSKRRDHNMGLVIVLTLAVMLLPFVVMAVVRW